MMRKEKIHTCEQLIDYVNKMGFLPLLRIGVLGWSAEEVVSKDCLYTTLPDGSWEWPLWKWKGSVLRESGCAYGKFFVGKTGFISREWWPDFCNYRRSRSPQPEAGSIEETILLTLQEKGSMITRELRAACGFTGPKMRGKFDAYITRLENQCRIVTEDFVYPHDRHGKEYGWGWALLTTPEALFGREVCHTDNTPEVSYTRLMQHLRKVLPYVDDEFFRHFLK